MGVCANGDSLWYQTYEKLLGPSSANYLRGLVVTPDGGFAGGGFVAPAPPDTGTQDTWLFRTDRYGYLQAGGAPPTVRCPPPIGTGLPEPAAAPVVAVWPNPAPDGRFTVQASPPAPLLRQRGDYVVTDVVGRTVAAGTLRGGETLVDLSAAPAGIYLLRLTWPNGRTSTHKLLR